MLRHEWAVASWAGSTGVIPRPHRKLAWNNATVVFRRVIEGTRGPNPLTGRRRTCESGVAGVHGRLWSLTIRRCVCLFALLSHIKKKQGKQNRDVVNNVTARSTNCILFFMSATFFVSRCVRACSEYFSRIPWTLQHLDIACSGVYKLVSTLFTSNKFLIVRYLRNDKNRIFCSVAEGYFVVWDVT